MSIFTLNPGGVKFQNRVMNPRVFKLYMMVKMPVLGVTGATLEALDLTRGVALLPYSWSARNMFGALHPAAIAAGAEIASAALLVINMRNQGASLTPALLDMSVALERPVREGLRLSCIKGGDYPQFVADAIAQGGAEREVEVNAMTVSGEQLGVIRMRWRLNPK